MITKEPIKNIVLVVIVLLTTGIIVWSQVAIMRKSQIVQQSPTVSPSPTPSQISSPPNMDGWKTYRNYEYRLELKYPEEMMVSGPEVYDINSTDRSPNFLLIIRNKKYKNSQGGEAPGLIMGNYAYGSVGKEKRHFIKEDFDSKNGYIPIRFEENLVYVYAKCFETNDEEIASCNNILSTFKVVDGDHVPTSSWKLYTNTRVGVSFRYPPYISLSGIIEHGFVNFDSLLNFQFCGCGLGNDKYFNISSTTVADVEQLHEDHSDIGVVKARKTISVGGEKALLITFLDYNGDPQGSNDAKIVEIIHKGKYISFLVREDAVPDKQFSYFLSTFKFTK